MLAALLLLSGCGYRVGSRSDLLPRTVQTIAVPAWENLTHRYRLNERMPAAISRELISRTRYAVVPDAGQADAVLNGVVSNYMVFPTVSDPTTGRAAGLQIIVAMHITLTERASGKVLFSRPGLEFRQRYEIAMDQTKYFEESDLAIDRLSRDVARSVVSAVLESF
ncbi:MAG TPA: LPS assembly lipoprotein LptE [Bryobacteraceae bacterium]|nr:LPS assembly lipoprotein LptE [Bryobacteraceae bacterium]